MIEKEYFAIFSGFVKFDQYLRGRQVTLLTDSKVLLHAFRSANHKIRRWYSFVQGFEFDVRHITSEQNALCDALTRCVSLAQLLPPAHGDVLPTASVAPIRRSLCRHFLTLDHRQVKVVQHASFVRRRELGQCDKMW